MDPAALGTLRIGLDAIDAEAQPRHHRRRDARRRTARPGVRAAFAAMLRRTADVLEPRPLGDGPGLTTSPG